MLCDDPRLYKDCGEFEPASRRPRVATAIGRRAESPRRVAVFAIAGRAHGSWRFALTALPGLISSGSTLDPDRRIGLASRSAASAAAHPTPDSRPLGPRSPDRAGRGTNPPGPRIPADNAGLAP